MPVRDAGRRRGCHLSRPLLWAVRSRPPRLPQASADAGTLTTSRNRGQPPGLCTSFLSFFPRCREPTGVPGQISPSTCAACKGHTRDAQPERPGSSPGLRSRGAYAPNLLSSFGTPELDGAAAGGIPLPGATRRCLEDKCHGTFPAMFTGQINRRILLPARGGRTLAGIESGGNAEVGDA